MHRVRKQHIRAGGTGSYLRNYYFTVYSIKAYSTQDYEELILWDHKKIFQDKFVEWDKHKKDPNTPLDVIQGAKRMEIQQQKLWP